MTNSGTLDGTTHYVHDRSGNVIAELNASGATVREYIWLPEAEIAPTAASRATIDRPVAVVDGVGGASPATYYVHADHLHRPLRMTNAAKSIVWSAEYQPWGAVQSLSGALTFDLRFPGQWFQLEAGLHYNWHRHYDASLGCYTQADLLGFVDGPSVYGYAGGNPLRWVDPDGQYKQTFPGESPRPRPGELPGAGAGGGSFPWPWPPKPKFTPIPPPVPDPTPTPPEPPKPDEQCKDEGEDCKDRMSDYQIRQCEIDAHELKREILGRRAQIALYELCKCKNGEVAVRLKGCKGPIERTGHFCL